jgi:hypothetical protein
MNITTPLAGCFPATSLIQNQGTNETELSLQEISERSLCSLFVLYGDLDRDKRNMKHSKIDKKARTSSPAPQPSDYLDGLDGDDLTDEQKQELLETLFNIMKSFVMMGHGIEPVNRLIAEFQIRADQPHDLLDCDDNRKDHEHD